MKRIILLISLFITSLSFGQVETLTPHNDIIVKRGFFEDVSVGMMLNHNLLRGDAYGLSSKNINKDINLNGDDDVDFGLGIRIAKHFNKFFDLGLDFNIGRMTGIKEWETNQPYYTREAQINYMNFNVSSRFYFSKLFAFKNRKPFILGYLELAPGLMITEAKTHSVSNVVGALLPADRTDDEASLVLGLGGGAEFKLFKGLSVDLGTKIFFSNSDKIDGIYAHEVYDNTDQNKYNDVFWISHLGVNYDFAKVKSNSLTHKWHRGSLIEAEDLPETGDVTRIDTVYIYVQDTTVINMLDTVVDKVTELVEVKPAPLKAVFSPVYFDTDSYLVRQDQVNSIDKVARYLIENPTTDVVLHGYADKRGSAEHNLELSRKRVEAVKKVLSAIYNIDESRIKSDYSGEQNLRIDQDNLNRRVDFDVK